MKIIATKKEFIILKEVVTSISEDKEKELDEMLTEEAEASYGIMDFTENNGVYELEYDEEFVVPVLKEMNKFSGPLYNAIKSVISLYVTFVTSVAERVDEIHSYYKSKKAKAMMAAEMEKKYNA